jgi:hypothetical protein|tara:strand:- start:231 stop:398 length:168 start_codon:yes stop_codon:yes gene_type:complete
MAAIQAGPSGIKQKETKRKWPVEKGLTGGTQSQEGRTTNLVPRKSLVNKNEQVGL